jgi:putative ABC transport system ATP-binding protein
MKTAPSIRTWPPAASENVAPATVLALREVSKSYEAGDRAFAAVSRISLDIAGGRLTALMGPSGSGKTTLLSIMGGILRPSEGTVAICGQDISRMDENERCAVRLAHVGFVFQSYNLFPTLTAQQNIEIVLDLKGVGRAERRAQALRLLEHMELADKAESYPADLSGGQKQRVAIARAIAGAPKLLLADEPTAALDSVNGRRIMKLFHDLTRAVNCAVVVVTHDARIVEFADRVMTIEDGRITADEGDLRPASQLARLTPAMFRAPGTIPS